MGEGSEEKGLGRSGVADALIISIWMGLAGGLGAFIALDSLYAGFFVGVGTFGVVALILDFTRPDLVFAGFEPGPEAPNEASASTRTKVPGPGGVGPRTDPVKGVLYGRIGTVEELDKRRAELENALAEAAEQHEEVSRRYAEDEVTFSQVQEARKREETLEEHLGRAEALLDQHAELQQQVEEARARAEEADEHRKELAEAYAEDEVPYEELQEAVEAVEEAQEEYEELGSKGLGELAEEVQEKHRDAGTAGASIEAAGMAGGGGVGNRSGQDASRASTTRREGKTNEEHPTKTTVKILGVLAAVLGAGGMLYAIASIGTGNPDTFRADASMENEMSETVYLDLLYAEGPYETEERKTCHQVGTVSPDGLLQFDNAGQYRLGPGEQHSDSCSIDWPSGDSFHVGVAVYDGPPSDISAEEIDSEEVNLDIDGHSGIETHVAVCTAWDGEWTIDVWVMDQEGIVLDEPLISTCTEPS